MPISGHLLLVIVVHGVFSQYSEAMVACLNLLNVPIKNMINASLHEYYGPVNEQRFNLVYALCTSALFIGLLTGLLTMGYLIDKLGRKETAIVLRCVLATTGSVFMVVSYATVRFEFFVAGQFLTGITCALKTTLLIYLVECSPNDKRGLVSMVINSGGIIATVLAAVITFPSLTGSDRLWFVLPTICGLSAIVQFVIAVKFPQSPKQLYIQKHKEDEARAALHFYYGEHYDIDKAIREMEAERTYETQESICLCAILKHNTYRCLFGIVLLCALVPPFSAFAIKIQYLYQILTNFGLSHSQLLAEVAILLFLEIVSANRRFPQDPVSETHHPPAKTSTAMLVLHIAALPTCLIAPVVVERFGRRCVFVTITALCALEWFGLGIAQVIVDVATNKTPAVWFIGVLSMIMGGIAVNLGLLIMSAMMIAEICPHNTRAAITQFTQSVPIAISMLESMMYLKLVAIFGAGLYFFHAVGCTVLAILLYKKMVETATMSVDQIVQRIERSRCGVSTVGSINYGAIVTVSKHHISGSSKNS